MTNDQQLEVVRNELNRADEPGKTLENMRVKIGALIIACEYLTSVVADQQRQIERLEDAVQNHLETEPRRRRNNE